MESLPDVPKVVQLPDGNYACTDHLPAPPQQYSGPQVIHQHVNQAPPDRTVQRIALGSGVGAGAVAAGVYFGPLLVGVLTIMSATASPSWTSTTTRTPSPGRVGPLPTTQTVATTRGEHWIHRGTMRSVNGVRDGVDIKSTMTYARWLGHGGCRPWRLHRPQRVPCDVPGVR